MQVELCSCNDLSRQIDARLAKLAVIMKTDVPAFNHLVKDQNIPAIMVKPPKSMTKTGYDKQISTVRLKMTHRRFSWQRAVGLA